VRRVAGHEHASASEAIGDLLDADQVLRSRSRMGTSAVPTARRTISTHSLSSSARRRRVTHDVQQPPTMVVDRHERAMHPCVGDEVDEAEPVRDVLAQIAPKKMFRLCDRSAGPVSSMPSARLTALFAPSAATTNDASTLRVCHVVTSLSSASAPSWSAWKIESSAPSLGCEPG
jgi:hypothetical protein